MAEELSRPSPDELLERVKAEESQQKRGKLKIFLGYAPGVGKTHKMLEAARQRKQDTDVVIAVVETHKRAETQALVEGLEIMPRRQVEYRGIKLSEMDTDAVIKRHPQLALVDELAHENAPGSRNVRRYQDVEELLEAGIDVYTTLNIQHMESVRNTIAQIIGIWVRETVPDSVIDLAAEIEVVDLPPDDLLKRLKEGKVYIPEQIATATARFFQKGNLIALRELTLRTAAGHVDEQTLDYMKTHSISGVWASAERLLVCLGPDSLGTRLIRSSRRLAADLGAEWSVIYVETPDKVHLSPEQQEQLSDTLGLAQRLGARTLTVQGDSIINTVMQYAVDNKITKIVVARPRGRYWRRLLGRTLADQLVRRTENIDVHVVGSGEIMLPNPGQITTLFGDWRGSLKGLGLVIIASLLAQFIKELFTPTNLVMLYLLCVVITAILWGFGPSVVVSIIGVLVFDFFFIPPFLTFSVNDTQYIFTFIVLLGVGLIISYLMQRIRLQSEATTRREKQTAALYALGRDLALSNDLPSYITAIIRRAKETFMRDTIIFLPDEKNKEILKSYTGDPSVTVDENESAAANWAFQHQKIVGHDTDTLPDAKALFLPLITARGPLGVMALLTDEKKGELTIEQERLLAAYADLAAIAIESIILNEQTGNKRHGV